MIEEIFFGNGQPRSELISELRKFDTYKYRVKIGTNKSYNIEIGGIPDLGDVKFMALIGPSFASPKLTTAISGIFSRRPKKNSMKFINQVIAARNKDETILDLAYKIDNSFYPINYPGLDKARYAGQFNINVYSVSSKARWASMDKDRGLPDGYDSWKLGRKSVASALHFMAELDLASREEKILSADNPEAVLRFEEKYKDTKPYVYEIVSNYIEGTYTHAMILPDNYLTESFIDKSTEAEKGQPHNWPIIDVSGHTTYGLEIYSLAEPIPDVPVDYHYSFRNILEG